jgi:AcrR family transcriptional regulator
MTTRTKRIKRLSRNDFLAKSMAILSQEGGANLNIDHLCYKLGVTKGSFYAHFESRADFVEKLAAHWAENYTRNVVDAINELKNSTAEHRLLELMRFLNRNQAARYDIVMRAWAAQDPLVAKVVREVDDQRFRYARRIFYQLGFRGLELNLRTQIFVVFHSAVDSIYLPSSPSKIDKEIGLLHAFFTRA